MLEAADSRLQGLLVHFPFFNSSASHSSAVSFLSPPPPDAGGLAALPVSFSSRSALHWNLRSGIYPLDGMSAFPAFSGLVNHFLCNVIGCAITLLFLCLFSRTIV